MANLGSRRPVLSSRPRERRLRARVRQELRAYSNTQMPTQIFPNIERAVYRQTPLVDVICQVRFPTDLRLDTTPPSDFQQHIRSLFPVLTQQPRIARGNLPPEFARALEFVAVPAGSQSIWKFATEDGLQILELLSDNMTVVAHQYSRWEDFSKVFAVSFEALMKYYSPPFLARVGLRYRNVIQRSKLNLQEANWRDLLSAPILAELADTDIEGRAREVFRNLVIALPERDALLRLQHGFAELEGSKEQSYLIDCDFFVERTEPQHVTETLAYFHSIAARCFRWCITERLHQAMEPRPA